MPTFDNPDVERFFKKIVNQVHDFVDEVLDKAESIEHCKAIEAALITETMRLICATHGKNAIPLVHDLAESLPSVFPECMADDPPKNNH